MGSEGGRGTAAHLMASVILSTMARVGRTKRERGKGVWSKGERIGQERERDRMK